MRESFDHAIASFGVTSLDQRQLNVLLVETTETTHCWTNWAFV
jgi:hypothetical protein